MGIGICEVKDGRPLTTSTLPSSLLLIKYSMGQLIFFGTPDFAVPTLNKLIELNLVKAVVSRPDKPKGRGQKVEASPVARIALDKNIPLLQPLQLNNESINQLKNYLPATFFIVAYGKIIPQTVLDLSELPPLNIHPSLLPELRGPSPLQTALLQGLKQTGVTLMQIDAEMDHGAIIDQQQLAIDEQDYLPELSAKTAKLGAKLTAKNITKYLSGELEPKPQNHEIATFCKMIKKEDGLINWSESAEQIRNKIRAFTPWPGAYFFINDKRFKILKADLLQATSYSLRPEGDRPLGGQAGTWQMADGELLIGTSSTPLIIQLIQPEGKAPMSGQAFYNGYSKILDAK